MYSYIVRRLAFGALTVIGVSIIVFIVLRILPGDPLVAIFGPEGYTKLSEAERAHYMAELGLSDPLWVQYLHWIKDIAQGNFGRSFFRAESVGEMILRRGPLTAEIAILSVILSWLVAFNVVNTRNPAVAMLAEFLYRITEPVLAPIRNMLPNLGGLDISPIILILIIMFIERVITYYIYPIVF